MAIPKARLHSSIKPAQGQVKDAETKREIDRQHTLLSATMDKKQLRGNATVEDWRHHRESTSLVKKDKREHYQIKKQQKELLDDLRKVRCSYTGHYDDTKTPLQNIQRALRTKHKTPATTSTLAVNPTMRRCKSNELLRRPGSVSKPASAASSAMEVQTKQRPKTASAAILTKSNYKAAELKLVRDKPAKRS